MQDTVANHNTLKPHIVKDGKTPTTYNTISISSANTEAKHKEKKYLKNSIW